MNGAILIWFCGAVLDWNQHLVQLEIGGTLPFGHVKKKPIEKALLQFAASLNIEVQVCVRVLVNKSSLKPLTAEVLAVENAREIFAAALLHQTEKTTPSRGGASSAAIEETDS